MTTFNKVTPDDRLQRSQFDEVKFDFSITAAKTASQFPLQAGPLVVMFDTGDSTQAAVDSLLGTANDVVYATSFSSTSLGTDAVGFVIAHGSARKAVSCFITYRGTVGDTTTVLLNFVGEGAATTTLASALSNKFAVTPAGNLYGKAVVTGIDACTTGTFQIVLRYEAA
jgi:hypothetical protein